MRKIITYSTFDLLHYGHIKILRRAKEFKVDTFVMGDDWEGKFDFLKDYCEVVSLPRTPEISTTQIKQELKDKK